MYYLFYTFYRLTTRFVDTEVLSNNKFIKKVNENDNSNKNEKKKDIRI